MDVELSVNPETVCYILTKVREFQAKEEVVIPETPSSPGDDWAATVLENHLGDFTFQEAKNAINDLEPDQQMALVALMWLGRGDFEPEEWADGLQQAQESWTPRTADYLIATPLASDYLEEGLGRLGYSCAD